MELDRREFVALTVGAAAACAAALAAGCQASGGKATGTAQGKGAQSGLDVGPVSDYTSDGVYDRFRQRGCFVIRRQGKLTALSSICTHRTCVLSAMADQSFHCPCHGSRF